MWADSARVMGALFLLRILNRLQFNVVVGAEGQRVLNQARATPDRHQRRRFADVDSLDR